MRKLLLATTAILGASLGMANAAQIYSLNAAKPQTVKPGSIAVNITLRMNSLVSASWGTGYSTSFDGKYKNQPFSILGYGRLYLGVDGVATNGLKYGMLWEIRVNGSPGNNPSSVSVKPSYGGNSGGNTLFSRRDYVYLGTAELGTVRLGTTDGPMSLFITGAFDNVGTGGWNGDFPNYTSISTPQWPLADASGEYTTAKIVYLSPKISGFDFGLSFEPNSNGTSEFNNGLQNSTTTSLNLSSGPNSALNQKRLNTIEVGVRYEGAFSGVGVQTSAIGIFGGHVQGPAYTGANGKSYTAQNLAEGEFGLGVTYAGFRVGGDIVYGQGNGYYSPSWSDMPNQFAWVMGASYTVGAFTFGGDYFRNIYGGMPGTDTQEDDHGMHIGANYDIAPGLSASAGWIYGWRYNSGYDFSGGEAATPVHYVQQQAVGAGIQVKW